MAGTSTDNPRTDAARERTGHDAPPARKRPVVGGRSIDKDARDRAYVAALQRDLNRHLVLLGSPTVLAVDGRRPRGKGVTGFSFPQEASYGDRNNILLAFPDANSTMRVENVGRLDEG